MPRAKNSLRKSSLKYSTIEGSYWGVMYGAGEAYLRAFFEYLKYSSFQIAFLTTFPFFIGSIVQNISNYLFHVTRSRKKLIKVLIVLQSFSWICFILIGIYSGNYFLMLSMVCIYNCICLLMNAPHISWMGYLVPARIRGRYFANRIQVIRIFMFVSTLICGLVLDFFRENTINGFLIIFSVAFVSRMISLIPLNKKYEQPYSEDDEQQNRIDIRAEKYEPIKNFFAFNALFDFAISINGPLVIVYWMRDLGFNYFELAIITASSQFVGVIGQRFWGKIIDNLGSDRIMFITASIITFLPLTLIAYYFLPKVLIFPAAILAESLAVWIYSGKNISMDNKKRYEMMKGENVIQLSSKNLFYRGTGVFFGGIVGGYLSSIDVSSMPMIATPLHIVMIISCIFRILVWSYFLLASKKF